MSQYVKSQSQNFSTDLSLNNITDYCYKSSDESPDRFAECMTNKNSKFKVIR